MENPSIRRAWLGQADCRHCAIRHMVLFSQLGEHDFDHIHRPVDELQLEPGHTLYRQGETATALYTLRGGIIKLAQYAADGTQRIVRLLRSGDVIGLEALVNQPYSHDAVVLQRAILCRLPLDLVRRLDRESPPVHQELMRRWQHALSEADAWLTQLSTGSARVRVARLLMRIADPSGHACNLLTREDMGAMLGITMETASRTVAAFRREGAIRGDDGQNLQCDVDKLREITGEI